VINLNRNLSMLREALLSGRHLFLATDFDGTLAPIASTPCQAQLSPWTRQVLARLNERQDVTVAIVSGRSLRDVAKKVCLPVIMAGNHGLEITGPELSLVHPQALLLRPELLEACAAVEQLLPRWPGAWLEDKHLTATVHFRNVDPSAQHRLVLEVRALMGKYGSAFGLRAGRRALEIRPRVGWDKGSAVAWIREQLNLVDPVYVCLGDDQTDEAMFSALPGAWSVLVGNRTPTAARFKVEDTDEAVALIGSILEIVSERSAVEGGAPRAATAVYAPEV
jgi:trehalose 6-phosphate phosphatase